MNAATTQREATREDALVQLSTAFKGAMAAIRRLRGRDTHRHGALSFAQYQLLHGLAERQECSAGELALAAELSPATATQMLDSLVEMGLVERTRSERDRRVVTCTLTVHGRELTTARRAQFEQRWHAALAAFSTAELKTAAAVIDQLRSIYDELDTGARPEAPAPTEPAPAPATGSHATAGSGAELT
jgi:DNA-binding MarR family transcriptional regulator